MVTLLASLSRPSRGRFDNTAVIGLFDVRGGVETAVNLWRCPMKGRALRSALLFAAVPVGISLVLYSGRQVSAGAVSPSPALVSTQPGGGDICYHTFPSDRVCPDSAKYSPVSANDILRASVSITTSSGTRTIPLPPGVDAVFLTRESAEKFLLPYYFSNNREKALALMRIIMPR